MDLFATLIGLLKGIVESLIKLAHWRTSAKEAKTFALRQKDGRDLLDRFLLIFETLDVPRPLIPKFLAAQHLLTVQQACSDQLLLTVMTDALIEHTAKRLVLPPAWLYGTSSTRYQRHRNYKNPMGVLGLLQALLNSVPILTADAELIVVSNRLMYKRPSDDTRLILLLRHPIDEVEGREVIWVHVIEEDLPWHHEPARIYAKQVVLIAMLLGVTVKGRSASDHRFKSFEQETLFAWELADSHEGMWHPDDYVLLRDESHVAKDVEESGFIRDSLEEYGVFAKAAAIRNTLGRQDLYQVTSRTGRFIS
jgi:hypothetical protein